MTRKAPIGIVCGSGINLNALLDSTTKSQAFADFPSLPDTAIMGHQGLFVTGSCDGIPIILQCGRLHSYEGHALDTVVAPTNTLHSMGARSIIFTNAAGGLNEEMKPGDLLAARSLALWPSVRWQDPPTSIDTDFRLEGCDHEGTYTWIHGPCYETPAEIRALQSTGSDAVGMSTAPEIARCHQLGIRAASISCITNNCCSPQTLTHEHVLEIAAKASLRICEIIRASLHDIHA
ncbi:purine-nucleoside phosphorylase [bacterium AH-315-P07]|nr:purine-nucleoside phosphorylase [bacterium AH-315-P07]